MLVNRPTGTWEACLGELHWILYSLKVSGPKWTLSLFIFHSYKVGPLVIWFLHPMKTSLIYPWIHPSPRKQRSDAMARSGAPPRPYWMPCGRPCPEQVVPPCSTAWPGSWRDLDESLWINSLRGLESMGISIQHMEVLPFCHAKCGFKGILMRYLGKL